MQEKQTANLTAEQAATFVSGLLTEALHQPKDLTYTIADLIELAGVTYQYKRFNRPACQRIAKAFKTLTQPAGTGTGTTLPYVECLGYNKDTKMSYRTIR